jgi:hypothetical protein
MCPSCVILTHSDAASLRVQRLGARSRLMLASSSCSWRHAFACQRSGNVFRILALSVLEYTHASHRGEQSHAPLRCLEHR